MLLLMFLGPEVCLISLGDVRNPECLWLVFGYILVLAMVSNVLMF